MKFWSMRNAIVIASVIVGSVIPSQAFAEKDVLTLSGYKTTEPQPLYSQYTFQAPMILNSIGFLNYGGDATMSYSINGGTFVPVSISDPKDSSDLKWYTLNQSVTANTVLVVKTENTSSRSNVTTNSGTNVVYNHLYYFNNNNLQLFMGPGVSNSNIRVSNPGSNVAPEPGSFALALTGGAALIGICVRRRRNAG